MDKQKITKEVNQLIDNLDGEDERTKEYQSIITNAKILHQIECNQDELDLKKSRDDFDRKFRLKQFNFEKKKFENDIVKMNQQHDERMAEIEVNRIKAENEKTILKQNQMKLDHEFKSKARHDRFELGVKIFGIGVLCFVTIWMYNDTVQFERVENGILPKKATGFTSTIGRVFETIIR